MVVHSKRLLLSMKNFYLLLVRLKQFVLMAPSVSGSTQCREITEISIY